MTAQVGPYPTAEMSRHADRYWDADGPPFPTAPGESTRHVAERRSTLARHLMRHRAETLIQITRPKYQLKLHILSQHPINLPRVRRQSARRWKLMGFVSSMRYVTYR